MNAVLWHQGEADFLKKLPAKTSQSNMQKLIVWTQALQPGLEWVVAMNSHKSAKTSESGEPDIRKAQLAVIEAGLSARFCEQMAPTDDLRA
ncbi:MAG: hypothetical protein JXL80_12555 [Planctomycetes bacterium]|nr:hypothetical protein [Planctomycetota bacterium]